VKTTNGRGSRSREHSHEQLQPANYGQRPWSVPTGGTNKKLSVCPKRQFSRALSCPPDQVADPDRRPYRLSLQRKRKRKAGFLEETTFGSYVWYGSNLGGSGKFVGEMGKETKSEPPFKKEMKRKSKQTNSIGVSRKRVIDYFCAFSVLFFFPAALFVESFFCFVSPLSGSIFTP